MDSTRNTALLTKEEVYSLITKAQKGDKVSLSKIIAKNQGLVYSIAKKYYEKCNYRNSVDLEDFVSEGNIGLIRCVEKFNLQLDLEFSTYATVWIKQRCQRLVETAVLTVNLPVHVHQDCMRFIKCKDELKQQKPDISDDEIFLMLGYSKNQIRSIQEGLKSFRCGSLNKIISSKDGDDDTELGDFIEDHLTKSPEEAAIESVTRTQLEDLMHACLTPKECAILKLRFGFTNGSEMTLEEIGRIYNVTRERIRQIQDKSLVKLRRKATKLGIQSFR